MSVDARTEQFEHVELCGKPALFSNQRVNRDTVPQEIYCYELRGSDNDPGQPVTIEKTVLVNHAGTVLTATMFKSENSCPQYIGVDGLNFLGECLYLADFCEMYNIRLSQNNYKFTLRPANVEKMNMFYALSKEQDASMGTVGHVRIDFGSSGTGFYHTWWPRGTDELNSAEFKEELKELVIELRNAGPLKDRISMRNYCYEHGGCIDAHYGNNFGYIIETEEHRYYLRCNPSKGDYNAYLTAFNLHILKQHEKRQ